MAFLFAVCLTGMLHAGEEEEGGGGGGGSGRVLRHAVFFKFKDSSSEKDIEKLVAAFAALPTKIDSIAGYEWGKCVSGKQISGGLTHCFLLTFRDEAGRAKYLPHPAHQAFVAMLRPHLDRVFVIDYWAKNPKKKQPSDKVFRHMVFFKFKSDAKKEAVDKAIKAFAALPTKIDSIVALEWGTNNSPESHDAGFTHAFMVTFASKKGLEHYTPHPDHQALVKLLRPVLEEVRVLDFTPEDK